MSNNSTKIFDFIAPIYAIFYKFQVKYYNKIILQMHIMNYLENMIYY